MHLNEANLNKVLDALMSRDPVQCMVAQSIIVQAKDAKATPELLAAANALPVVGDDLEIDDDAGTSDADGGTWVQAWLWVPVGETDEDEEAEEERGLCSTCWDQRCEGCAPLDTPSLDTSFHDGERVL